MSEVRNFEFTTLKYLDNIYMGESRILSFKARNRGECRLWQRKLRKKVKELLAFPKWEKCLLKPVLLEKIDKGEYIREKIVIQSEKGIHVPLYVLIPKGRRKFKPVLAIHGHGSWGADTVAGVIGDEPGEKDLVRECDYNYGEQFAKRGFIVFVPCSRAHGERMEPQNKAEKGVWKSSCRQVSLNAILLGRTLLGMRVWDTMRVMDYIKIRPENIGKNIGCVGLSGGGTVTLFLSALDLRVSVSIICGYFNTFHDSIMAMNHCECNYVPGILRYAEMYDICGLIAPRQLLVVNGKKDTSFPIKAAQDAYERIRNIYKVLGAEERIEKDFFGGGHAFSGRKAFSWFEKWL